LSQEKARTRFPTDQTEALIFGFDGRSKAVSRGPSSIHIMTVDISGCFIDSD
jgi:hypothetical protein